MKKWLKITIIIVAVLTVLLASSAAVLYYVVRTKLQYNYNPIPEKPEDLGVEKIVTDNNDRIVNIALFGVDSRDAKEKVYSGRSDTIMILSINTKTKKIKVISVMRDSLVPVERSENNTVYCKINAAYNYGGAALAIKTLNKNFHLDITDYATVNFFALVDIIDAIGGIDVPLTEEEVTMTYKTNINGYVHEICRIKGLDVAQYRVTEWGTRHLNGVQAVAYTRMRYCKNAFGTNNDYGRTDRQRYVIEQLFNKVKTMGKTDCLKLAEKVVPYVESSLSFNEIIELGLSVMLSNPTFEQYRIPQNDKGINFLMKAPKDPHLGSVVYYDLEYAAKVIHAVIYDDMTITDYVAANPVEKNNWYAKVG